MGNRCYIIFENKGSTEFSPAVYLHWNGGPESIYPFLDELDRRDVRADQQYEAARFCQIVGEFLDQTYLTGLSLGVSNGPADLTREQLQRFDPGDNGIYVVCREATPRRVRRFSAENCDNLPEEWPADKVNQERAEAYRHEYNRDPQDSIATKLLEITGSKPTEMEKFAH